MGRVTRQEKDRSRERIVSNAARRFRGSGIAGASVAEVMKDAGLTHGGFYRHFANKDALLDGALTAAFADIIDPLVAGMADQPPAAAAESFRQFYLSNEHLLNPARGCPAAALAGEIARGSESTKRTFASGVRAMIAVMSRAKAGDDAAREADAARELAMLVGAMALARASDAETADLILSACRPGDAPQ